MTISELYERLTAEGREVNWQDAKHRSLVCVCDVYVQTAKGITAKCRSGEHGSDELLRTTRETDAANGVVAQAGMAAGLPGAAHRAAGGLADGMVEQRSALHSAAAASGETGRGVEEGLDPAAKQPLSPRSGGGRNEDAPAEGVATAEAPSATRQEQRQYKPSAQAEAAQGGMNGVEGQQEKLGGGPGLPTPPKRGLSLKRSQSDVLTRIPPQNIHAEQSVLGSILIEAATIDDVAAVINAADFYRPSHAHIFQALQAMAERAALALGGDPAAGIDMVTLEHELKRRGVLEEVGGVGYLADLATRVPTSLHAKQYAGIVKECAVKRQIIARSLTLIDQAFNGHQVGELAEQARQIVPATIDGSGLPALITRDIQILSGKQFAGQQANVVRRWVVEGWLARKEISLWSGKVEHGKTTLLRTLVMCVMRGEMFLERHVYPGVVLYVMLDADGPGLTYELFLKLGWNPDDDPIHFLIDPVMCLRPNSFEQFHAQLLQIKPSLVVIDPIGRFQKIEEGDGGFNGYGMTYAMARFSELAKRTDCHIALLHHIPRGRSDQDDAATAGFGSIAIAGGCNARFVCLKKPGDMYTLKTSKGKGGGFMPFDGEMRLEKNPETEWVTLAGAYDWKDEARALKAAVTDLVMNSDQEWTSDALGRALKVQRSTAGLAGRLAAEDGDIATWKDGKRYMFASHAVRQEMKK